MDDENMIHRFNNTYDRCQLTHKYCDCSYIKDNRCEDEDIEIPFKIICDGFQELLPMLIDGQNHTDETECSQWACHNEYTRCNDRWNCPNGADETGCSTRLKLKCSLNEHHCITPSTNELTCLSIERINDGIIDCVGGTDETELCRIYSRNSYNSSFYCDKKCIQFSKLCDGQKQCLNGDDELFCVTNRTKTNTLGLCTAVNLYNSVDSERFVCKYFENRYEFKYSKALPASNQMTPYNRYDLRCHRGIDILIWLDFQKKISSRACLCPSMYYGPQCQYQKQRVTLTIQFRALSDSWQTLFEIIISLIDNTHQRTIHAYERITFLWQQHCRSKFHFYLLYSTRPKDLSKNYSIHIDFYEKDTLKYRGSSLYSIDWPFLPVYRLSISVEIPPTDDKNRTCSDRKCIHGQCIRYQQGQTFCHCDQGWSGVDCSIEYICTCSSTSRCIGILPNNRSICACQTNQFGSRCYLNTTICQNKNQSICLHGGRCISNDNLNMLELGKFFCICPEGYTGDKCEQVNNQSIVSFSKDLILPPLIYIHLMYKRSVIDEIQQATILRTINPNEYSVSFFSLYSYYSSMTIVELSNKNYYRTSEEKLNRISSSDRCPNITELFNQTFIQWSRIRRVKYYHLPCYHSNLSCFHDEKSFCFCNLFNGKRIAKCFLFDHNITFDCDGRSECENDGQCSQNDRTCPKRSICYCKECFYGRRCQFSTNGFGLSLDSILGYRIEPDMSLFQQSAIVQFSLSLTIIFTLAGLTDGFLSLITFKNKSVRNVGCGIYLLWSSITTILVSVILLVKFSIVLHTQMKTISNRIVLGIQCYSLDFLLRICLYFDHWLTACVSVERTCMVIQEVHFDKKKSRQSAKYVILCLLIVLTGSFTQDPFHRRVIDERNDDNDEIKRTWCIVTYPSKFIRQFNSYMHTFHFLAPFSVNLLSAIFLITIKSRQQLRIDKTQTYKQILRQQYKQYKHLLIAPIILVLLALPRLILTFTSRCMQSSDDAWLYIILYFISFIPSMVTFIVFILPSKLYKIEFDKSLVKYGRNIRQCLRSLINSYISVP